MNISATNTIIRQLKRRLRCPYSVYSTTSKIPEHPTWKAIDTSAIPLETEIDAALVDHLERLALVDFGNQEGIERRSAAVRFANQLCVVDTTAVEPMDTVLEATALYLREDKVTQGNCQKDILANAKKTVEEYFVAPPGNIPLARKERHCGPKDDKNEADP